MSATWARSKSAVRKRRSWPISSPPTHVAKLKIGQAHYSGLLYEHGGFVDDILVHKVADDHYFLCVNASNQEKDFEHIRAQNRFDAQVENASDRYAQLAIQGPRARATLQKLTPVDLAAIRYYWFTDGEVAGAPARIAHTGYTGEDGFEIYVAARARPSACGTQVLRGRRGIRHQAVRAGRAQHAAPGSQDGALRPRDRRLHLAAGSRARLDREARQGRIRGPRRAGPKQKESGVKRKLVGFEMRGRGIGRDGYEVLPRWRAGGLGDQRLALAHA